MFLFLCRLYCLAASSAASPNYNNYRHVGNLAVFFPPIQGILD